METVREFAERVLFGKTLEDKLSPPSASIEDRSVGRALEAPLVPGRPQELQLREDGVRAEFPGVGKIESDEDRGRLLHFFANHELLATELMALVLLKFPDAPTEFRAGILKTLKEEQMHTKLYLRRMEECGVKFGELPLNGFFWNLVSSMETPLDYVTRLSLTFEQANLDYSRGYARAFSQVGDEATAQILDRIYRDEINHVHYGLSWFRKWKEEESDWQSYKKRLSLPLSAARAKGRFEFNEEGRRQAGLDEEFIRELKVYARSKGRTPNVFWFNPGAEESLTKQGESEASRVVGRDLGMLVALLARKEDVVLLDRVPSTEHLLELKEGGVELPELVSWENVKEVKSRKLGHAKPWAATPSEVAKAAGLGLELDSVFPEIFSKIEHADLLGSLLGKEREGLLGQTEIVGEKICSVSDLEEWLGSCPWAEAVVKAPWSTAGRERRRVSCKDGLSQKDVKWVGRLLSQQNELLVEPWLDRVLDFSTHYDRREDGSLVRRGFVVMKNSEAGQFREALVTRRITDYLEEDDRREIFAEGDHKGGLFHAIENVLQPGLEHWLGERAYRGPLGVDSFFYRDRGGQLRLKLIAEINPRYTMGRVAIELDGLRKKDGGTRLGIQPVGRALPEGCRLLTPVDEDTRLVAYWR